MISPFSGHSLFDRGLTDDHLKAIGAIAFSYSLLEEYTTYLLALLINRSDLRVGQVIVSRFPLHVMATLVPVLYDQNVPDEEKQAQISDLMREVTGAAEKRNAIFHAQWDPGESPELVTRVETSLKKGELRIVAEQMSTEDWKILQRSSEKRPGTSFNSFNECEEHRVRFFPC